jgi:NADH-quinone oxidoreductase subunit N
MFVGLGFKVSGAPFQIWAPDVYQGAPTPVSAFLSTGPKAAAFAIFLRIFMTAFGPSRATGSRWCGLRAALHDHRQLRRAHCRPTSSACWPTAPSRTPDTCWWRWRALGNRHGRGDVLPGGLRVHEHRRVRGGEPSFRQGRTLPEHRRFRGPGQKQPLTAALLTIFLLSLIGVPLTGGFFGKFYIFKAALESHLVWLTVLGLLNSAVAAYYYLRILVVMGLKRLEYRGYDSAGSRSTATTDNWPCAAPRASCATWKTPSG